MGLMMDEPNAKAAQSKLDIKLLIEMELLLLFEIGGKSLYSSRNFSKILSKLS